MSFAILKKRKNTFATNSTHTTYYPFVYKRNIKCTFVNCVGFQNGASQSPVVQDAPADPSEPAACCLPWLCPSGLRVCRGGCLASLLPLCPSAPLMCTPEAAAPSLRSLTPIGRCGLSPGPHTSAWLCLPSHCKHLGRAPADGLSVSLKKDKLSIRTIAWRFSPKEERTTWS